MSFASIRFFFIRIPPLGFSLYYAALRVFRGIIPRGVISVTRGARPPKRGSIHGAPPSVPGFGHWAQCHPWAPRLSARRRCEFCQTGAAKPRESSATPEVFRRPIAPRLPRQSPMRRGRRGGRAAVRAHVDNDEAPGPNSAPPQTEKGKERG